MGGKLFDTMVAHSLVEPEMRHGMDYLSEVYLGYTPVPISKLIGEAKSDQINMADVPVAKVADYSAEDADVTWQLRAVLEPLGGRYLLAPVDADKPWGQASTELVNLLYQGNAVGIIAVGRNASHLAEQLSAKTFFPVIAISADTALTAVNLPWIFRLPVDAALQDAVGAMTAAADQSGPNRGRLRDALGSSGRFDNRGEPRE